MIKIEDLMQLSVAQLKEVINMAHDVRLLKGKELVKNMAIGTEFKITGNKNVGKVFILTKVNRTKVVAKEKNTGLNYTIPFGMVVMD